MKFSRRQTLLGSGAATVALASGIRGAGFASTPGLRARIDDYLTRLSGFGYSGATLLAVREKTVLRKGYGLANDAGKTAIAPDTIFDIGSLAKTFTAAAAMMLAERGKLHLDDPISKHLDGVPADKQAITVEQLLSHTSGLDSDFPFENETAEYYEEVSREEALKRILATKLLSAPGTEAAYSNIGYILVAAIVEQAGGKPFRDFLRCEIFIPLGMTSTGFWGSGLPQVPDRRLARSYDETGETANLRSRSSTTWMDLGGGEVVSTVDNLYAWMRALRADKLLSAASRKRMWTPGKGGHGLGWFIEDDGAGGKRIHHGGDYVGFCAELAYYPDHNLVLANLANRRYQILSTRYAADRVVPQIALGEPPQMWPHQKFDMPPRWVTTGTAPLESAAGTYALASGAQIAIVKKKDGRFVVGASGQDAIDLLSPASAAARALRVESNERAIALVNAAVGGDTKALEAILRLGAPVESYQKGLARTAAGDKAGKLLGIDVVGTAPYGFPFGGRITVLHFRFEKGEDFLRLGWDPKQNRVINMGMGSKLLGSAPLRASPDGAIVGWNIVTGRSVRIVRATVDGKPGIRLENTDCARVFAKRMA